MTQQTSEAGDVSKNSPPRRRCVLVAEDDEVILELICNALEASGYEVNGVSDGLLALEEVFSREYDLLVTDHEMPRIQGLELIERMRDAGLQVPTIIASGTLSAKSVCECPSRQVVAVLHKPFCMFELLSVVEQTFQLPRASNANTGEPACES